jgi:hypothetical protein
MAQRSRMSAGGAARQMSLLEGDIAGTREAMAEANRAAGTQLMGALAGGETAEAGREFQSLLEQAMREREEATRTPEAFAEIGGAGLRQLLAGPEKERAEKLVLAQLLGMEGVQKDDALNTYIREWLASLDPAFGG